MAEEENKGTKEKKKKEVEGIVNIYTSFNNTIVHVTDFGGETIAKVTGGMVTNMTDLKQILQLQCLLQKESLNN